MRRLTLFLLAGWGMTMAAKGGDAIQESRWEHRLVAYVLADAAAEEQARAELAGLEAAARERDLRVVPLGELALASPLALEMDEAAKARWRERFGVETAATRFWLIGKDGGVKATQEGRLDLEAFFRLIDTMPMRRAEMRRDAGKGAE